MSEKVVYDYICFDCEYTYIKKHKMGKGPKRTRCPGCNNLCMRDYSRQSVHFVGSEWHTNKNMERRSRNSKADCKKGWELLHKATGSSLDSATTEQFYKRPSINWDTLEERGQARRLTPKELENRGHGGEHVARQCKESGHIYEVKKT